MRKYYESEEEYPAEEKYLYLLLFAPGHTGEFNEPVKGSTWLQKIMHVLSQNIDELRYEFDAHNFGTFSPALQAVQIQNATSDLIEQENEEGPLSLTEKGLKVAKKLWRRIPTSERSTLTEIKEFLNDMSMRELIAFSYSTFPETTANSEIISEFFGTRIPAAISLFKRQKISLKKAASIAGLSEDEFLEELKKRKIPAYSLSQSDFRKSLKHIESFT